MSDKEYIWQCECGSGHYLKISRLVFSDGEIDHWLIMSAASTAPSFWWRITECWKMLFQNTHEAAWIEVYLAEDKAREIAAALIAEADVRANWQGKLGAPSAPERITGWRRLTNGKMFVWWLQTDFWWNMSPIVWIMLGAAAAWLVLR